MKKGIFRVGDRVIPINKTAGLFCSRIWLEAKKSQGFLYVNIADRDEYYVCDSIQHTSGDYFAEEDLVPFEPTNQQFQHLLQKG